MEKSPTDNFITNIFIGFVILGLVTFVVTIIYDLYSLVILFI